MAHAANAFDKSVNKFIDKWKVPGLRIAIVQGDKIHAKFRLADILKSFTVACVALVRSHCFNYVR